MLTKEAENVAKSIPSFIDLCSETMNPLAVSNMHYSSKAMELASKCIWLILPFHFLVLLAIAPQSDPSTNSPADYHILARLIVAFSGIIIIFMIGSIVAFIPAGEKYYRNRANLWTASILTAWFFSVVWGAVILAFNFLISDYHFDSLHKIFYSSSPWLGWLYASFVCSGLGTIMTFGVTQLNKKRILDLNSEAIEYGEKVTVEFYSFAWFRHVAFILVLFLSNWILFFTLGLLTTVPFFG